ncbi:MAG: PorP/SprF family type IX secretion system membrane protein [Flavobacteriales bacterium]|nr:PorP/SprF family type IX secretion system membrane protein [Flavobacteriales bacterium]
MKLKLLIYILSLSTISSTIAQDIHLAQSNMTPLLVNPANAGAEYTMRGILNYRNQWGSVSEPFVTMMASFDMNLKKAKRGKRLGYFAGGIYMFKDEAGSSEMKTTQFNLSVAYHINLNEKHTLGLGVQGGYFQRSANTQSLSWGNQFDGYQYNQAISTGEGTNFTGFSFGATDYTSGIVWTFRNKENFFSDNSLLITSGISLHHLTKPDFETQHLVPDQLHYRFIWHGNAIVSLNSKLSALPYVLYSKQGPIHEILFGSDVLYKLKNTYKHTGEDNTMAVGGGLFYRWNDAIIASIILQYSNYTLGFSYDINTSSLNNATNKNGGFEFSLRYVYPNPFGGTKSKSRFN